MGRMSAVSDLDYWDEMNPHLHHRLKPCQKCGGEMTVVCNGNGEPVFARCEACAVRAEVRKTA